MSRDPRRSEARRVTRDVEPSALKDLLEHPPRATVAFVDRDAVEVLPVQARFRAATYQFGVQPEVATDFEHREVVLVIDDGAYWPRRCAWSCAVLGGGASGRSTTGR